MVLFDLADASWFPLVMVFGIGAVMLLLFLSMRREIGKISVPRRDEVASPQSPVDQ